MDTVLKCINGEEKQNVYPMFTLVGLKTTKPLENQEVSFCFSDPAGNNLFIYFQFKKHLKTLFYNALRVFVYFFNSSKML